jgi:hypothetical protein
MEEHGNELAHHILLNNTRTLANKSRNIHPNISREDRISQRSWSSLMIIP